MWKYRYERYQKLKLHYFPKHIEPFGYMSYRPII